MDRPGFNPELAPISIHSAANMLKVVVGINERPYDKAVKTLNNNLVDEWRDDVLAALADKEGNIAVGKVWNSWEVFIEGFGLRHYEEVKSMLVRPSMDQLEFWKKFFSELSVTELCNYGPGVLDIGWLFVTNEIRLGVSEAKWERVFSKSDDPLDWEKMPSAQDRVYLRGEVFPFWDHKLSSEYEAKVRISLQRQARPFNHLAEEMMKRGNTTVTKSKIIQWMKQPIHKNDRPYTQEVCRNVNGLIDQWAALELTQDEYELDATPKLFESWMLYTEGLGVRKLAEVVNMIPRMTQEQITWWLDFYNKDIEELYTYGLGIVGHGWFCLQYEAKVRAAIMKLERVFVGLSPSLTTWRENAAKNPDLMIGSEGSFWSNEEFVDLAMKVGAILSNPVRPQSSGPRV